MSGEAAPTIEESVVRVSIDHLLEGVQIIGFDWKYLYLNETAAAHGEREAATLVGKTMMHAYPGIEQTELFAVLQRVMHARRPERMLNEFMYPSGKRRSFKLVVDPVPAGICVLSLDVTDTQVAEQKLRQAQKLEAIGQLAAGVAHDFNNMLTAILGYSELITEQIGPDKPIGPDLQEIVVAAQRAAALTRRLLAFSRSQDLKLEPLSLHRVIAELEPMLRRLIPENIGIRVTEGARHDTVMASATQIEQALINLVVNARDAMVDGGVVTVATRNVAARVDDGIGGRLPLGEYTILSVHDTGIGMTPETRERIFEPFFTTKGPGHGTGLGLVAVQDIVSALGGRIHVDSAPGQGATFELFLPTIEKPVRQREPAPHTGAPVGRETILLVEDDPGARSFARKVLTRFGYSVVEAVSGEAALAEAATGKLKIDLVLADLVLPGIDGVQLTRELSQREPHLRALFMTGYLQPPVIAPKGAPVLAKPFTAHELLSHVRQTLG
jgi:signal transduction histidine kinase